MEQTKQSVIIELACAGNGPATIAKALKYPSSTVYRVYNSFMAKNKVSRTTHKPRNDKKRKPMFLAGLNRSIKASPGTPMSVLAKKRNVDRSTISRATNKDLKMTAYKLYKRHILTEKMKAVRVENGTKLLNNMKSNSSRLVFFSNEKSWTVDRTYNVQNDRHLATDRSKVPHIFTTKFPASIMTLGVICSNGAIMPPVFFKPKERVGAERYCNVLAKFVIPWMKEVAGETEFTFQQDSAPAHKAKKTMDLLKLENGELERKVCKTHHNSINSLKASIKKEWAKVFPADIIKACKAFQGRIKAMLAANRGHIE
ncbi:uncharacterized protein LOC131884856 [Tigriopus californicus]|uniref:uncharacterized protein LOC131884856 n=1 Tax=Tigriopus californicus TaxID=6832 RepID=UPI0027DA5A65|nr:uncharacterized protein LOC131884856 [Tigriopus californicus]